MPKLTGGPDMYRFVCPGCKISHRIPLGKDNPKRWKWNGSVDSPTLSPSILITTNWGDRNDICHSFVRDGKIQYLDDCTHHLAGQTIDLPDIAAEVLVNA